MCYAIARFGQVNKNMHSRLSLIHRRAIPERNSPKWSMPCFCRTQRQNNAGLCSRCSTRSVRAKKKKWANPVVNCMHWRAWISKRRTQALVKQMEGKMKAHAKCNQPFFFLPTQSLNEISASRTGRCVCECFVVRGMERFITWPSWACLYLYRFSLLIDFNFF